MFSHSTSASPFSAGRLIALLCAVFAPQVHGNQTNRPIATAPFQYLDNVERDYVLQNAPAVRPMVLTSDNQHLYALNVHANRVLHFPPNTILPTQVFHTPRSPVSIALWDEPIAGGGTEPRLVVVCRDTWAMCILDRTTGDVLELLEMREPVTGKILGEPGDLLVVGTTAYVSCSAADAVAEVDLTGPTVTRVFKLPGKHPLFMSFDEAGDVLVAPMLSGNNSAARGRAVGLVVQHVGPTVLNLPTAVSPGTPALPDSDLFRIVRSTGAVQPVTTGMGTIQFACGVNPKTHRVWQLNTEAHNKDSARQTEALIRGDVVANRLSIADLPAIGGAPASPAQIVDLDTLATGAYDPTKTVGQPYALLFDPASGAAVVTGLLTDTVFILSQTAAYLGSFSLPDGSIPRGVLANSSATVMFVYCWGTNKIEVRSTSPGFARLAELDLGLDPTPARVKAGRRVFYDAAHSLRNNASCASCHIEGRTDMLVWNLSKSTDDKGPLVTQTLDGINRMVPFHWRGEQQNNLADFNPAFPNLLGATAELDPASFADFEAFVLALEPPPNPFEHERRLVDDKIQPLLRPGDSSARAVTGQSLFVNNSTESCEKCHNFPTGSSNEIVGDSNGIERNPRRQYFKVAGFLETWRKEQDANPSMAGFQPVSITLPSLFGGPDEVHEYGYLGAGTSHAGLRGPLIGFLEIFTPMPRFDQIDLTAFVNQWDQGIAPATYRATLLDQAHYGAASTALNNYLLPQARQRHCDLVLFGKVNLGGSMVPLRWSFDRTSDLFVPEDPTQPSQPASYFTGLAQTGQASVTCVGVPVGMGRGFGIDFDRDDMLNKKESKRVPPTNPDLADTDADGWPDGHEDRNPGDPTNAAVGSNDQTNPQILRASTQMVTTRVARLNIETDEPCTLTIQYTYGGATMTKTTSEFAMTHSVLLDDLIPSEGTGNPWITYTGSILARDQALRPSLLKPLPDMPAFNRNLAGNPPAPVTTRSEQAATDIAVIGSLTWSTSKNVALGTFTANATVRVDKKRGVPPPDPLANRIVVARVFKNDVLETAWTATGSSQGLTSFNVLNSGATPVSFSGFGGPFLLSNPTSATGFANLSFTMGGLTPGDVITLNIEVVSELVTPGSPPTLRRDGDWNMPSTLAFHRGVSEQF